MERPPAPSGAGDPLKWTDYSGLTDQFDESEAGTLVIVQNLHGDEFFSAVDQQRLADLLKSWRDAREKGESMTAEKQADLSQLVDRELDAATQRSAAIARELRP